MSEPLSSTEIEDVLSSIRRLVSDDLRPLARPTPASVAPASSDKLILTPALRVVQDDPPPVAPAVPYRLHLGLPAQAEATGLDQIVAAVGAAVDAQPSEWEAETGDAAPVAAGSHDTEWQADDVGAPFFDGLLAIVEDEAELILTDPADVDAEFAVAEGSVPIPGWAQQDPEPVYDLPAEETDVTAVAQGTIEPDPAWADAAEASVIASLAADLIGEDDDADSANPPYGDEPMLFDEEVLRELVRDILREELAGRMGERITRNIRKLVRAEIARSFATQEFE